MAASSSVFLVVVLFAVVNLGNAFNYSASGADWPATCKGSKQSPINIVTRKTVRKGRPSVFKFEYSTSKNITVVNSGHGAGVSPEPGSKNFLYLPDGKYSLLQFHFHAFSEHAIDGTFGAAEGHLVHQSLKDPSKLAVLGVIYYLDPLDRDNAFLAKWLELTPKTVTGVAHQVKLNPRDMILSSATKSLNFYHYDGSLTTPPCSEVVSWNVFESVQYISVKQLTILLDIAAAVNNGDRTDNRPPQPLFGRTVTHYKLPK
eukprot:jgi/Mesen1/3067/ME000018S02377